MKDWLDRSVLVAGAISFFALLVVSVLVGWFPTHRLGRLLKRRALRLGKWTAANARNGSILGTGILLLAVIWILALRQWTDFQLSNLASAFTSAVAAFGGVYFAYQLQRRAARENEIRLFKVDALETMDRLIRNQQHVGVVEFTDVARRSSDMLEIERMAKRVGEPGLVYQAREISSWATRLDEWSLHGEQLRADAEEPAFVAFVHEFEAGNEAHLHYHIVGGPRPLPYPVPDWFRI